MLSAVNSKIGITEIYSEPTATFATVTFFLTYRAVNSIRKLWETAYPPPPPTSLEWLGSATVLSLKSLILEILEGKALELGHSDLFGSLCTSLYLIVSLWKILDALRIKISGLWLQRRWQMYMYNTGLTVWSLSVKLSLSSAATNSCNCCKCPWWDPTCDRLDGPCSLL